MEAAAAAAALAKLTPDGAGAGAVAGLVAGKGANPLGAVAGLVAGKGANPLGAVAGLVTGANPLGAVAGLAAGASPLDTLKGSPIDALTDIAGTPGAAGAAEATGDGTGNAVATDATDAKVPNIQYYYKPAIKFTEIYMRIFAPPELCNTKNSRILLNVIMLYAINYIFKYQVEKPKYEVLKEIRDYLKINKDFLLDKTLTLSKDYLDIVHDAVEDIKLAEERDFLKQQDNEKMDSDKKIADNDLTFNYVKLVVDNSSGLSGGLFTTITSAIANIWKIMMMWTKPFAGLVILVGFIAFIILVFFGEDDEPPENSGGVGTGSLLGPSNFNFFSKNMQGSGGSNNNTDIISVLQRLPQNIYSFFDKLSKAYSKFSNYANSSSDFMNSLSDTTPIIKSRTEKQPNTEGLYDNIYTFDYNYINHISKDRAEIEKPNGILVFPGTEAIFAINLKPDKKGRYLSEPRIIIPKPTAPGSTRAEAKAILTPIAETKPPLYEIDRIDIITGGSKYKTADTDLITIEDPSHIIDNTLVYNIKMPKKGDNPNISEYYGISHDYKFDIGGTNNEEYIYAPKCGKNNDYVYDDCTVKIKDCGEAKMEDTSDYKNIII